jgi:TP901 family phage tail tape measure protein
MAIEKDVKVVISAVDEYSAGIGMFNTSVLGLIAGVEAVAAALVASSIAAAGFATKLGGEVFQSATDFHDAMYNVEAVAQSFGTTGEDIGGILDKLTQKFPITGAQAGEALQMIAQMGYGTVEQLDAVSNATNELAIATGAQLQTAVEGTLSTLNAFGLEVQESERVTNLFAAVAFSSAASVSDLATAMRYAGSTAALAGISVEETAAMIGKLRDRGLEASQAGTTLRMALAQLLNETDKGAEALAKYGLTYADVNPEVNSLADIIGKFEGHTLTAKDAVDIFGVRAAVMAGVINDGKESFVQYTKSVTNTTAAADAYVKKLETWKVVQENVIGTLDLFKKTIAGGIIPEILHFIGTTENEGIRGILNYTTQLETKYGNLQGTFADVFSTIRESFDSAFAESFGSVEKLYEFLSLLSQGLGKNLEMVIQWGAVWAPLIVQFVGDYDKIKLALNSVNAAFLIINGSIALVHDVFVILYNAWADMWNLMKDPMLVVEIKLTELLLALHKFIGLSPFSNVAGDIEYFSQKLDDLNAQANEENFIEKANYWLDDMAVGYYDVAVNISKLSKPIVEVTEKTAEAAKSTTTLAAELRGAEIAAGYVSEKIEVIPTKILNAKDATKDTKDTMLELVNATELAGAKSEEQKKEILKSHQATQDLNKAIGDGYETMVKVGNTWTQYTGSVKEAETGVANLDKKLSDMTDREFTLYSEKFKAELDLVAQESAQTAELVKTNIEWQAKLDIEQAKAAAEVLKAAFESVGKSVEATAEATSSMVSDFSSLLTSDQWISSSDKSFVQRMAEEQLDLQKAALENQTLLTEAQAAYLDAQTKRIENLGDEAQITVVGDGLKPHLEAIMWELFEAIRIRATAEGLDKLLLGVSLT